MIRAWAVGLMIIAAAVCRAQAPSFAPDGATEGKPSDAVTAGSPSVAANAATEGLPSVAPPGAKEGDDRRVLVMLRIPPAHFRPDASYGGGYDAQSGRTVRHRIASELASAHQLVVESDWPMVSLGIDCFLMKAADGRPLAAVLDELAQDSRTAWAQPLHRFHSLAHNDPLFALQPAAANWHLAEVHTVATGRNVSVAQLDTGVELAHPDLVGQISVAENFVDANPYPAEAHGTAVAGIIAARADNGIGIAGVAPSAKLMALRACWQIDTTAACNSFTLAKALQFALERGATVINLSVTGPEDKLLHLLLDAAVVRGVTVVGAVDPVTVGGGFPASHPGVIAVSVDGSVEAGDAAAAVTAPGHDVPTTLPVDRWGFVDGSSFAAAHVSGLVALLQQLAPSLGPEQTRALLRIDSGDGHAAQSIDACAVVARAARACSCNCGTATSDKVTSRH
ncbi:MAG TPA: S8 family serine peptidase [Burkholderiaceae bacterium]|nr:S8 family serine peptidase [Burkholderiaceae bacterium]